MVLDCLSHCSLSPTCRPAPSAPSSRRASAAWAGWTFLVAGGAERREAWRASPGREAHRHGLGSSVRVRALCRFPARLSGVLVPGEVDDAKSGRRCARRSLKIFLLCFPSLFAGRSSVTASGACRGTPTCCMRAAVWLRPTSGGKTFSTVGLLGGTMPSTTGTETLLALTPRFCVPWMASFDCILRYFYGSCRPSLSGWPCFPIGTTAGRQVRHPWDKCCV